MSGLIANGTYVLGTTLPGEVAHDNTLTGTGLPNSPLSVVNSYNETVLFDGNVTYNTNITLSESYKNFERLKIINGHYQYSEIYTNNISTEENLNSFISITYPSINNTTGQMEFYSLGFKSINDTTLIEYTNKLLRFTSNGVVTMGANANNYNTRIYMIIGINRKSA